MNDFSPRISKITILKFSFLILILLILFSCTKKIEQKSEFSDHDSLIFDIEELEDLYAKYDNKEISNCDELLEMANDMSKVYFNTIYLATKGSERAKSDFFDFEIFQKKFETIKDNLADKCPNILFEWNEKYNMEIEKYKSIIDSLYRLDTLKYNYKQLNDSVYRQLQKQIEDLDIDLIKFNHDSIKNKK
ncbi:MAG: hypothetical protein LBV69_06110 [Bacteroidales bacterium]|jgi:hypothetical protein|nr:hypothetical protein [Bacteroidales bacterium]